ncbi:CLUMA_CG003069, isoform A [Clunio marinus]|uniref:CLUMA_CG003069, isoform A n=1 Tax=Clunio marinus TaxID=568069 RepID=A0A1J1HS59_9DIPT|nr:CLUMA_CG003069, isoform A [Clunio marinus]
MKEREKFPVPSTLRANPKAQDWKIVISYEEHNARIMTRIFLCNLKLMLKKAAKNEQKRINEENKFLDGREEKVVDMTFKEKKFFKTKE